MARVIPPPVRELPTWIVAVVIHLGWLSLTWHAHALPAGLVLACGAVLVAWHGSLQHEAVHGHPTWSPALNALVAGAPLSLWLPFSIYRDTHLAHHACARLTDPLDDPESYFLSPAAWQRLSRPQRLLHRAHATFVGRLVLGPFLVLSRFARTQLAGGARTHVRGWITHLVGVALVLAWVIGICHVSLGRYLLLFVYPGMALTLVRSFAEHRPAAEHDHASVVVESGAALSLLFLNNNLHAVHHTYPALPWYELPRRWQTERAQVLARNGHYHFGSYAEIARRYFGSPKASPVHPGQP